MRSTEDQFQEILKRTNIVKEKRKITKKMSVEGLSAAVCLALLVLVSLYLPRLKEISETAGAGTTYGSFIVTAPYAGYIVVGILACALGARITLLCVHLHDYKKKERKQFRK